MNENKPAYGSLTTGKVLPAHVVAEKADDNITEEQLCPIDKVR